MNPLVGEYFSIATVSITAPFSVLGINLIGGLWRGKIRFTTPMYFALGIISVIGTGETIQWPRYANLLDYELEFGIFIGKTGKDITREKAREHIFGYTIFNDFSARDEQTLEMPGFVQQKIVRKWKAEGGPPFHEFAPYTAHVLTVDAFFYIAVSAHLISRDRPSNRIDMAYLYYLPFCMVFVSSDSLHEKTVPLFLSSDQAFVHGRELKSDLARLDQHYSCLPPEVRERGIMVFAHDPPEDTGFLTTRLWDRFLPKWREIAKDRRPRDPQEDALVLAHMKRIIDAPRGKPGTAAGLGEPDFLTFERSIPVRMGKWRIVPPEAEREKT